MMIGHVNAYREAVISLSVEGSSSLRRDIDAVIDTGFDGYLTRWSVILLSGCLCYLASS